MPETRVSACQSCGASIYPEHMDSGIAGYHGGKLLCPHCYADQQKGTDSTGAPLSMAAEDEELSPIALPDEDASEGTQGVAAASSSIYGFSGDTFSGGGKALRDESKYNRRLEPNAPAATRCRTFHAKLNEGAVAFMNDQINSWVDSEADIRIKFASSTIGIFEGKHADPNLIVTVFY